MKKKFLNYMTNVAKSDKGGETVSKEFLELLKILEEETKKIKNNKNQ